MIPKGNEPEIGRSFQCGVSLKEEALVAGVLVLSCVVERGRGAGEGGGV